MTRARPPASPPPDRQPAAGEGRRAARRHRALLATADSPYYQVWVLTNLTAKPFAALFGQRFHLNLTEWRLMLTLADHPGVSAQELSDYTGLDKMSVSRVVRSLEAQGRLQREGSESDRRKLHLFLTEAGWKVYEAIATSALAREAQIYASLSSTEFDQLRRLLAKLSDKAREAPVLPDA